MMQKVMVDQIPSSLSRFLQSTEAAYQKRLASLSLFDIKNTANWSHDQKKKFAGVFYHLRGHFINFMWYVANFSSNEPTKTIIMNNIHEEIGLKNRYSHEKLYERFAEECAINIHKEIIDETHYLSFARDFNKSHLQWLSLHDEDYRIAAFAAYERLDNVDYPHLLNLATSLNLSQSATTFFNVHVHVDHFDSTLEIIVPIWENSPDKLIESFEYIFSHQYQMWENLSNVISGSC